MLNLADCCERMRSKAVARSHSTTATDVTNLNGPSLVCNSISSTNPSSSIETSGNNNNNSNNSSSSSRPGQSPACLLCPLCRHECADGCGLEQHLLKQHHVSPEGLHRLMLMVDWPLLTPASTSAMASEPTPSPLPRPSSCSPTSAPAQPAPKADDASAPSPDAPGEDVAASTVSAASLPSVVATPVSVSCVSTTTAITSSPATAALESQTPTEVVPQQLTPAVTPSVPHTGAETGEETARSDLLSYSLAKTAPFSSSSLSSLSSSSLASASALDPPPALRVTSSSPSTTSSLLVPSGLSTSVPTPAPKPNSQIQTVTHLASTQPSSTGHVTADPSHTSQGLPAEAEARLRVKDESREVNLELLNAEHAEILSTQGVDLQVQERLDKEFEELFRCQTCTKSFSTIDQLCNHQNELGHLELKQTPRGPGYLCWKKGCNQYFKTASTLQVHFREIHARRSATGLLTPKELEAYEYKCGQCSFAFRSLESMQRHTLVHLMQSVTQCRICSKLVSSVRKLRRHLELEHRELSETEMKVQLESIEANAALLYSSPAFEQFTSKLLFVNGDVAAAENRGVKEEKTIPLNLTNGFDARDLKDQNKEDIDEKMELSEQDTESQFLDDYVNSQSMAESNFNDPNRKFKCHICHMAFTKQVYLMAHNRTSQHRQLERRVELESMADNTQGKKEMSKSYRCEVCRESFPSKGLLLVHTNSAAHIYKLKQQVNGERALPAQSQSGLTQPITSSAITSNGNHDSSFDVTSLSNSIAAKPYKCNICKVSYNNAPSLDIHMRSVAHKTKANKLGELIQTGQVDVTQTLIEHPDPKAIGKQQAQLIADMIHQQASAQAASNAAASYYSLQGIPGMNTMAQLSLLQGMMPAGSMLNPAAPVEAFEALRNATFSAQAKEANDSQLKQQPADQSKSDFTKDKCGASGMRVHKPDLTEKIVNMVIKQDGNIEPASEAKMRMNMDDKHSRFSGLALLPKKEEEFPPNFPHAPVLARPRGYMGRFKPQLHRSLLENFGFECVMHFNEENLCRKKGDDEPGIEDITEVKDEKQSELEHEVKAEKMEVDEDEKLEETNDSEKSDLVKESANTEKKDENKENIDLPELSRSQCKSCKKDFSNVWVLKNHEEAVHNSFIAPDVIENFGKKFKEEWEKNLPKVCEYTETSVTPTPATVSTGGNSSTSTTPSSTSHPPTPNPEKAPSAEMPPPPPPSLAQIPNNFDMSQLLPLMGMNLLPMHLPMNLMNLGLQSSLMPSLMLQTMDLPPQGFLPQMAPPHHLDSSSSVCSPQQHSQAAANAAQQAQNQKRVRTRISDDQLKVLRQYFDINNSPSEEQINKMSEQTGLPQKVIKHWFRNTLFKERQRNKDSPYNFNNPPSTSIDLDEYDRTGKIPEVKTEPEEDEESAQSSVMEVKKEAPAASEDAGSAANKDTTQDTELLENPPLKIDLAPVKSDSNDDSKKDQDSHSNTSSPSNVSSIPSTPTASAPATPTPIINSSPMNANPLAAFSLDAYAANMARIEAATFQSMGKRANRTRFTDFQIKTLQDYFERNAYPKDDELEHLSKILGLSARVIVVWFQNARQKARKIYENQPNADLPKEVNSPFQRTPGLNYQCKKCNSVFQRYYELIKHQKNSCGDESNNNKLISSVAEDDSNSSYASVDNKVITDHVNSSLNPRESLPKIQVEKTSPILSPPKTSSSHHLPPHTASATPVLPTATSSSSSPLHSFKCDKCPLTFSRFDMWEEHQKAHSAAPAIFTPFSSSSAFGMLQTLAHQEDNKAALTMAALSTPSSMHPSLVSTSIPTAHQPTSVSGSVSTTMSTSPSPSSKRKTDSEDEGLDQPRDKRLRTTILPEQLDYLYQQYQVDCNPSRKQLEHIANTVNLKKRVVQVWFQNTRARERKGHYRAHQQLINKRCPFCRALFRAKSALESHLATKHPEEMAKGDINVDLIPDAMIENPQSSHQSATGSSSMSSHTDISKLLPPGAAASMPNYMAFMSSAGGLNFSFPTQVSESLGHSSYEDPFFKKYMSDLANTALRQDYSTAQTLPPPSASLSASVHSTPKPSHHSPASELVSSRPADAHKAKPLPPAPPAASSEDAPLDLSKPVKSSVSDVPPPPRPPLTSTAADYMARSAEMDYLRRLNSLEDSFSETHSEMADHEYLNEDGSNSPSPSRSSSVNTSHSSGNSNNNNNNNNNSNNNTPCSSGKRYRTQMSATQVKVMKHLFVDYKTPTMAECELLGQEIGLAKRVVQVWFQNARAKEKKAKLTSGKPYNAELDFPKSPEECKLCNYKYTHKVTVQDHIFTKAHIDKVKASLNAEGDRDFDMPSTSLSSTVTPTPGRAASDSDRSRKMWEDPMSSTHLAQLQAMGMSPSAVGFPLPSGESSRTQEKPEILKKDKKSTEASVPSSSGVSKDQQQVAIEMAMNAQMMSALGGYLPGLDPAYLSYMYGGLPGYLPGMGLPMMPPSLMPGTEHMLAYDPLSYGTPLALLQIPAAAIKSVSEKLSEPGAVLARYTQDCQALADLHNVVSAVDLTVAAEATLDVGYICKKCQMVYPARESCIAHQRTVCLSTPATLPKGFEPMIKLEQMQYECRACNERFSTILEFKGHCQLESHKSRVVKYRAKEAARREAAGSPNSSSPYSSSNKVISPSSSYSSPKSAASLNNNVSSACNNNTNSTTAAGENLLKPALTPSPAHQLNKMSPSASAMLSSSNVFREKALSLNAAGFGEFVDLKRLKAE